MEIRKYSSFEEADEAEIEYWSNSSVDERINTLLYIQELMLKLFYPDIKGIEKIVTKRNLYNEEQD